ncbi:lipoprotein [Spiroplasma sp. BIUS-1]|uniref:lipoprotein n=1 Tax=Spiroplasma sp. BIUS-1 TaxID=216964 RepID=UPI0013984B1E|nr:lipoprotein [Spiroplasma sp. BIUS-1]QHX36888.1 hypothetical protein SBIUS_v1c06350 [Spiroplasma sp. BIUS-1]
MKKLLTLLGSVSLIATTAQMAVACGTNYDKKDKDGNSILIQFLQSIDGKAQITSTDVLWKLINKDNGPKNREKLTLDLLKMINLSILSNSGKQENIDDINDKSIYTNYNLSKILQERWTSLSSTVDRQISTEKDKYKKDHGKKWEKEWDKMLVNKYSVYQDDVKSMDREFLENKYKSDILLSDENNSATKTLLDVLLNTDQMGVTWISSSDILRKYNALERIVNANLEENEKNNTAIANYVKSDLDQIAQIENSTKKEAEGWNGTKLSSTSSDKEIANEARRVVKIDKKSIVNDTPVNMNDFTVSDTNNSRAGFLSNSQRYFLDKFYNTQAPLAISEVVIPFSETHTFDTGVTPQSFYSTDGNDQKNSEDLLNSIIKDKDQVAWNRWMVDQKTKHPKATVKHYDQLMTLSNSTDFTQDMRSVVYDLVLFGHENGKKIGSGTNNSTDDDSKYPTLDSMVKELSRNKGNPNFYNYDDTGKVYYIDSTGMHIVQIDGYEYLEKTKDKGSKQEGLEKGSEGYEQVNKDTMKELNEFKKYNSLTDNQKIEAMKNETTYNALNTAVTNPYLHFLTNNSMLKGLQGSQYSFDIMSDVKNWSKVNSSDESSFYWTTCVFDYFFNISNTKDKGQNSFIDRYITFNSDSENGEVAKNTQDWFYKQLGTKQSSIITTPGQLFNTSERTWTEEINSKTVASGYPKKTMVDNVNAKRSSVRKLTSDKFWMPIDGDNANGSTKEYEYSTNDLSYIFNYNLTIKSIENSYINFKMGGAK